MYTIMGENEKEAPRSIMELEQPDWMNPPQANPSQAQPPVKKIEPKDEPTGVENVAVEMDQPAPKPQPQQAPKYGNLQPVVDYLEDYIKSNPNRLPSKEELEKERRRKKTEGIISSIADMSRAFANLAFTTQYAPDMYRQESSMTGKWKQRYDDLKKQREADADRFLNYSLTLGKIKNAQEDREYQRGRDALQDRLRVSQEDRAQLKADRDAAMAELKMQLLTGQISEQVAATREQEIATEYAEKYWNARIDYMESQKNRNDRTTGRSGSGGGHGKYEVRDASGKVVDYANSVSEWQDKSVLHGSGEYYDYASEGTDKFGEPVTKGTSRKFRLKTQSGGTMPGVSGNTMPGVK